jgi:hypothetical protein
MELIKEQTVYQMESNSSDWKFQKFKMLKIISRVWILSIIFLFLVPLIHASEWHLSLNSVIEYNGNIARGQFIAGAKSNSLDGLDYNDGRMIESPSYSIPFYSIINNEYFMIDYKASLSINNPKTWQITQKGSSEFRRAGTLTETIEWDISNIPQSIDIILVDYGPDSSRVNTVQEINLRQSDSYNFEVVRPYQDYRYFNLVATLTEEICYESWSCNSWQPSTCPSSGIQTRSCNDLNNCGTETNKPTTTRTCTYNCLSDWSCTEWNECSSSGIQTRECIDINNCDIELNKPSENQTCNFTVNSGQDVIIVLDDSGDDSDGHKKKKCVNDWECNSWGECLNGIQKRRCIDTNDCNDQSNKPKEIQECSVEIVNEKEEALYPNTQKLKNTPATYAVYQTNKKSNAKTGLIVFFSTIILGLLLLYYPIYKYILR